jgi:hypothetical protein
MGAPLLAGNGGEHPSLSDKFWKLNGLLLGGAAPI